VITDQATQLFQNLMLFLQGNNAFCLFEPAGIARAEA
jgi:hypothetical protein